MAWDPHQYLKFTEERFLPFEDLFALIRSRHGLSVIDLGCGTGELTCRLAERLAESAVLGVDSSEAMLEKARLHSCPGVSFALGDVATIDGSWDLVFSNAVLHWVDDHEVLIPRLLGFVARGGQIALQIPSNNGNPSHTAIIEVAQEEPFRAALNGWYRRHPVLEIDRYASLLYGAGATDITVMEKVYLHILPDADAVAEWTRGSTLVPYLERLPAELHEPFMDAYRHKLRLVWPETPVPYTFRRIFMAATRQ